MTEEIQKLNDAVDKFAAEMKEKLAQKAEEGWTGWDNEGESVKVRMDIGLRCVDASQRLFKGDASQAVDAANLAMMLAQPGNVSVAPNPPYGTGSP